MSVGFGTRSEHAVARRRRRAHAASAGLTHASRPLRAPRAWRPWKRQESRRRCRRRTPGWRVRRAVPRADRGRAARGAAPPSRSGGSVDARPPAPRGRSSSTPRRSSVLPSRASASSRRLARTDEPTSSAPASTATATATPATTSACMAAIVPQARARASAHRLGPCRVSMPPAAASKRLAQRRSLWVTTRRMVC